MSLPIKHVLPVKYYYQFDSATKHGRRMCSSSSHAMLLKKVRPGALSENFNADDEYFNRMSRYGDTTNGDAQVACLRDHFGLDVEFSKKLTWADVEAQLIKGYPVPVGTIHTGHVSNPHGFGHWMCLIGWDRTEGRDDLIFHDPAGEMDVVNGGYPYGRSGKYVRYTQKNWMPRWRVHGTGGWGTIYHGRLR